MLLVFIPFTLHSSCIFFMIIHFFFNMFPNFKKGAFSSLFFKFPFIFISCPLPPHNCCVLYSFSFLSHPHPFIPHQQQVLVILKTKNYGCFQRKDI